LPLATWLATNGATIIAYQFLITSWGDPTTITSFAMSMAVNTLVTGLIVFRILKVFMEVKAATTSVERTLGTTGGTEFQHVIFIIIESGMALLAVQLVRVVLYNSTVQFAAEFIFYNLFTAINQMFNVIIRAVHLYFFCFTDIIFLARASYQQ
jgi:hypothetical protein